LKFLLILVASVKHSNAELPPHSGGASTERIESPPLDWLEPHIGEVWQDGELP
jgi:hypothetical protein